MHRSGVKIGNSGWCPSFGEIVLFLPSAGKNLSRGEVISKWGRGVGLALLFLFITLRAPGPGGATGAITGAAQDKRRRQGTRAKGTRLDESTQESLLTE